jgi:hypothetical protein
MLFGDHAHDVFRPWDATAAYDKCHSSMPAPNALDNIENNVVFAYDSEIAARYVPQPHA